MKSRTLCYDPATARMELRRFLPVWVLYLLALLLGVTMQMPPRPIQADSLFYCVRTLMTWTTFGQFAYSIVLCQLLFGDLYSSRHCYYLHALPITRGGYFGTQIILGTVTTLAANVVTALYLLLYVGSFPLYSLWWLEISLMSFLCFFGIGVFSAMCAGNRLGMLAVAGLIHTCAVLVYWMVVHVYNPLLYGVVLSNKGILAFSPAYYLMTCRYMMADMRGEQVSEYEWTTYVENIRRTPEWWIFLAYAAVGIGAIILAMRLYRRRKLECCGNLLAFDGLKKVFLVLFPLACGAGLHLFAANGSSIYVSYVFLAVGLVVGYFAGCMLVLKTMHVFTKRNFLWASVIVAVMAVTLTVTGLDPLGLTWKKPDPSKVTGVKVDFWYSERDGFTKPEDIALACRIHDEILDTYRRSRESQPVYERIFGSKERRPSSERGADGRFHESNLYRFTFLLEDGSEFVRQYQINDLNDCFADLRMLLSRPDFLFGFSQGIPVAELKDRTTYMVFECHHEYQVESPLAEDAKDIYRYDIHPVVTITDRQEIAGLVDAFLADCALGVTATDWIFHMDARDSLQFVISEEEGWSFSLSDDCVNTMSWLESHGMHDLAAVSNEE